MRSSKGHEYNAIPYAMEVPRPTPAIVDRVRLLVAGSARDADDCSYLLDVLGLKP